MATAFADVYFSLGDVYVWKEDKVARFSFEALSVFQQYRTYTSKQ